MTPEERRTRALRRMELYDKDARVKLPNGCERSVHRITEEVKRDTLEGREWAYFLVPDQKEPKVKPKQEPEAEPEPTLLERFLQALHLIER